METNFDLIINRHATGSVKWDFMDRYQNMQTHNLLPMWVSDFDFACPPNVLEALHNRVIMVSSATASVMRVTTPRLSTGLLVATSWKLAPIGFVALKAWFLACLY